jgi:hemolysin activation/secretion protein
LQYLGATGDPSIDAYRLGGKTGTRGFAPFGLWAEQAATATVEYQVPIAHFKVGTWTFNGFCDAGRVLWSSETLDFVTPGLGTRFYLKSVAFPAVGIDVSYATHDERLVISGSIGMSF